MNKLDQLKAENAKLKRQLDQALKAIDIGSPCPNAVGLIYFANCNFKLSCRECWEKAFQNAEKVGDGT